MPLLTGGPERKHQFAVQYLIAPKFHWASATRTRDGLLIVAGHQIKLVDWPEINFLCGGVLVKQNNNVSILTWEGNTTIYCMSCYCLDGLIYVSAEEMDAGPLADIDPARCVSLSRVSACSSVPETNPKTRLRLYAAVMGYCREPTVDFTPSTEPRRTTRAVTVSPARAKAPVLGNFGPNTPKLKPSPIPPSQLGQQGSSSTRPSVSQRQDVPLDLTENADTLMEQQQVQQISNLTRLFNSLLLRIQVRHSHQTH